MTFVAVYEDFARIRHEFRFECAADACAAADQARAYVRQQALALEDHPIVVSSARRIRRPLCRLVKLVALSDDGTMTPIIE